MTEKEKILAEIERLEKENNANPNVYDFGYEDACKHIKGFINSLPEELVNNSDWLEELQDKLDNATPEQLEELWNKYHDEEEPVSEDLEKAAEEYAKAKHQNEALIDIVSMDFKAGAQWQKQRMLQDAVERVVKVDAGGYPYIDDTELYDYTEDKPLANAGDKVKIIIVKED